MMKLGLWVLKRKTTKVNSQHRTRPEAHTIYPSHRWGHAYVRSEKSCFIPWEQSINKLFRILLYMRFVSSPFIYSSIIIVWVHKYIDIYFIICAILQYFLLKVLQFGHWDFFELPLATLWHNYHCGLFVSLFYLVLFCLSIPNFLTGYRLILYISYLRLLESAIFPRSSGFFHWRMVSETKLWGLSVLSATGGLLSLNFLSILQSKKIHVAIVIHFIYKYLKLYWANVNLQWFLEL